MQQHHAASDTLASCPRRHGSPARCPEGTYSRINHRKQYNQSKLNTGTWNVTTLNGKEVEIVEEARKNRLDILGISSTKKKGKGSFNLKNGWQLFYSGIDTSVYAQAGVTIMIGPNLADAVLEWKPVNERIALVRLQLQKTILTVIQVYAPNTETVYPVFLDTVLATMESVPESDAMVVIGNFNAYVGNDSTTWHNVIGRNGDADTNNQGRLLLDFCANSALSIMNTFFEHKDIHKYTWHKAGPIAIQKSLIDFILAPENTKRTVLDVRARRGAELATHHYLVVGKLRLSSNEQARKRKTKKVTRIRWESLADDGTRSNFARKVDELYAQIPPAAVDPESEWLLFQTAIINSATEACGVKTLGSQHGEKRPAWWSEDVRSVVGKKKAAYRKWIHHQTPENWAKYTEQRDNTKNVVAEAKKKAWEEFGLQLETDYHTANKVFWQTIRRLRKGGQQSTRAMKDSSGKLLTTEGDILKRWQEYFAELYNPMAGGQGTPAGHTADGSNQLSIAEVTTAIKSLRSGKAAGIDEIRPEMLKALSPCGTQWLTRICNVVWTTGKAPKDWQTGIVIPIFKKGDKRECSNYRGITLLSLPGTIFARVIERRCREIVEPQIQDTQCGFRAGRGTTDQIFTLQQAMEKSWEYNKPVYAAFIDL